MDCFKRLQLTHQKDFIYLGNEAFAKQVPVIDFVEFYGRTFFFNKNEVRDTEITMTDYASKLRVGNGKNKAEAIKDFLAQTEKWSKNLGYTPSELLTRTVNKMHKKRPKFYELEFYWLPLNTVELITLNIL